MNTSALVCASRVVSAALLFGIAACGSGQSGGAPATPTATPAFSLAAGTYTTAQSVSISDATAGAKIYYTTDGTTPTTSSTTYTAAITVSSTETLQAMAVATGHTNSSIVSAAYTVSSKFTAAQVNQALGSAQSYYQTLPHTSIASDLTALAAYLLSSGTLATARISPLGDGISGTLADGSPVVLFDEAVEYPGGIAPSAEEVRIKYQLAARARESTRALSPPNGHEVAFLVNESGDPAFTPATQQAFAQAFVNRGFASPNFGVDALDVSLENIDALGATHPIDYFDIATHGTAFAFSDRTIYLWASTTPITDANETSYQGDLGAGTLYHGAVLGFAGNVYFFTQGFLGEHLTFNPGAIFINMSCSGQAPAIKELVTQYFGNDGLGLYAGWDNPVTSAGSDQTDAFLLDRLLGEQSPSVTGLDKFATQFIPPQRPFPLAAIWPRMATENRNPVLLGSVPVVYSTDYSGLATPQASLLITNLNVAAPAADVPIENALPSISTMQIVESINGGTLTINGAFPSETGIASITDSSGTYPLTPTAWAPTAVTVNLPNSGNASSGLVTVISGNGIASNPVPLTAWYGQLSYNESDTIPTLSGQAGTGQGTIAAIITLNFRADVHPVVTSIDSAPQPQNLTFNGPTGVSTAAISAFQGSFTPTNGLDTATFSLGPPVPDMTPTYAVPLPAATFAIGAVTSQPATCNNGLPGPQTGPTNVFCPSVGMSSVNVGLCSDTSGTLCPKVSYSPIINFSYPLGSAAGSLLIFTMDLSTYAITVTANPALYVGGHFGGTGRPTTATMSGTILPPTSPPTKATPATTRGPGSL